ncbi:MAG: universal stress protein, partial [Elusimicrobia bacterium]|nr:universal stress protein [Elusimicrobiota bacterium]
RFPPSRILSPVDFSKPSLAGLELAVALARRFRASLDLLYVQEIPLSLLGMGDGEALGASALVRQMGEFRRWRLDMLRQAASGLPEKRVQVHSATGGVPEEVVSLARRRRDGLIVMGTHGYAGAGRLLAGSVTESVVHRCEVPVLATRGVLRGALCRRVLVPCNLEPYADEALRYALELARAFGARVTALYVAAPEPRTSRALLQEHLRRVLPRGAAAVEAVAAVGDPRTVVPEQAERGDFDLVVLSAHRKPIFRSLALGSTAENVLRHCPVPVLAVPSAVVGGRAAA